MGEIGKQTEFVIEKLIRALGSMGLTLDDVVKVNAYIDDARKWPEFNAAYNRHFTRDETRPARATIPAGRFDEGMCVELDVVALAPEGR
jgi:enamine deaminase RidA (YjgF/YER057c/UK114 family)